MADIIQTLVRNEPLVIEDIRIIKAEDANKAVAQVIRSAAAITEVSDVKSQRRAGIVASELQALRKGLEANYRAAKAPLVAAGRALDQTFRDIDGPLLAAYQHLTGLVSGYQDQERKKVELERAKLEADVRAKEALENRRLAEIQQAKQEAEMKARLAEDARERRDNQRAAEQLAEAEKEQKIVIELQKEEFPVTTIQEAPKPVGGRTYTEYEITVLNIFLFASAHPELVEITLKKGPVKDLVRAMDERGEPLVLKGLRIRKYTKTAFVGAASIRIAKEG